MSMDLRKYNSLAQLAMTLRDRMIRDGNDVTSLTMEVKLKDEPHPVRVVVDDNGADLKIMKDEANG